MRQQLGKGMVALRKQHSQDPFAAWHRDLGHCFHLLVRESISYTQSLYEAQEDHDALEILDTISKMFINMYAECAQNNLTGIMQFNDLYGYIEETGDKGAEVYNTITNAMMQTMFSYLFTSTEMAIGIPKELNQDTYEYVSLLNILGSVDETTRKTATKQLVDNGIWPSKVDHSKLLRHLDSFIEVIKEDHERIKAKAAQEDVTSRDKEESK
jgi:hypothetical protein